MLRSIRSVISLRSFESKSSRREASSENCVERTQTAGISTRRDDLEKGSTCLRNSVVGNWPVN